MKAQQAAAAAAQGLQLNGDPKTKRKGAPLEPALKRSIKGDTKGAQLPPPLTSSPLAFKTTATSKAPSISATNTETINSAGQPNKTPNSTGSTTSAPTGVFAYPSHANQAAGSGANPYASLAQANWGMTAGVRTGSTAGPPSAPGQGPANQPAVPDVNIPIVLGPIPPTHPDYAPGHPNNSTKEGYMVLHERKLILDPNVFGELTKEMLEQLEKMGAPTALSVLTGHMIRALKERRARERGKDRSARRPKGGVRKTGSGSGAPFTKVPLDQTRKIANRNSGETKPAEDVPNSADMSIVPVSTGSPTSGSSAGDVRPCAPTNPTDPGSPIIDIDGDSEDEGPAAKKRKVEGGLAMASA